MDWVQKMWMFENWQADQMDQIELAKNTALLLASFWNPQAVQQITGTGNNQFASDDNAFEESTCLVKDFNMEQLGLTHQPTRKRQKRKLNGD